MIDDPERDFAVEARMILQGLTGLLVERRHLEALEEACECRLITIVSELDDLKQRILTDGYESQLIKIVRELDDLKRRILTHDHD